MIDTDDEDVVSMRWYALTSDECREYVLIMIACGSWQFPGTNWPEDSQWINGNCFLKDFITSKIGEMESRKLISKDTFDKLPEKYRKLTSEDSDFWDENTIEEG